MPTTPNTRQKLAAVQPDAEVELKARLGLRQQ